MQFFKKYLFLGFGPKGGRSLVEHRGNLYVRTSVRMSIRPPPEAWANPWEAWASPWEAYAGIWGAKASLLEAQASLCEASG